MSIYTMQYLPFICTMMFLKGNFNISHVGFYYYLSFLVHYTV